MKVLSLEEMNNVSGAYSSDIFGNLVEAAGCGIMGGIMGFTYGAMWGGKHGQDGGGYLGLGIIGGGVGLIAGMLVGAIGGATVSIALGYETSVGIIEKAFDQWTSGLLEV